MSNAVDLVIASEAIKQVENLVAKLMLADAELLKVSQSALNASKNIASIATPSALDKSTGSTAALNAELAKQNKIISALELQIGKLKEAKLKLNAASFQEKINARIALQNATAEAKAVATTASAYQKLDFAHKQASRSAQDIGAKYGATSRQFQNAAAKANVLDKELKQIDATLGKSQRNVGNYSSAFNGLGSALGAFGIITGVAGVAMLGKNVFETAKELQGLDMALKQVSGSAEELATNQVFLARISEAYGAEIKGLTQQFTQFYVSAKDKLAATEIQAIFESITKAGASMGLSVESQQRAFLALNQMMSKGTIQAEELRGQLGEALPGAFGIMSKAVGVNEAELAKMMKAGDLIASEVLPKFAIQLEKTYGIENLTRVETLGTAQTRLGNSFTRMVDAINNSDSSGFARFVKNIVGGLNTILDFTGLLFKDENQLTTYFQRLGAAKGVSEYKAILNNISGTTVEQQEITKKALLERERETIRVNQQIVRDEKAKRESILGGDRALLHLQTKLEEDAIVQIGKSAAIIKAIKQEDIVVSKKVSKATKENTEDVKANTVAKRANVEGLGLKAVSSENTGPLESLKLLKKALEQTRDETGKNAAEFAVFNKSIEDVNQAIKTLTEPLTVDLNIKKPFEEANKEVQEMSGYLKTFVTEFAGNSGFSNTFELLSGDIENFGKDFATTFNALAEAAQEAFNFIANASQNSFEGEKKRLQDQYDISVGFAGDNAAAKTKLAEDLEEKQKEIANREAKAKQRQALFNIAIDTAQAVVAALPNVPLAVAVGVLGAVQLALVASQKIPQYKDGTDNHGGGLMLVNDGAGANFAEKVITPDGKEFTPQGRNVLLDAPKGTKVLTHDQQIQAMLNERGVSMNYSQNNSGMTALEMDGIIGKHFAKIQTNTTNFDRRGFTQFIESNGNRTIRDATRTSRTGFKV